MSFGSTKWQPWVLGEEEAMEQIKAAYDLGINAFDNANSYSHGRSEIILGKAIKKYQLPRDEIVVMTKAYNTVSREDEGTLALASKEELYKKRYVNQNGLSRKYLFEAVRHSLDRLQLDYIDLLQCHRFDPETPVSETMHALHDLVQAGLVRSIGMSSCYAWQFYKMQSYAREHGLTQFISMQNHYSPMYREEEREMMPMLKVIRGAMSWIEKHYDHLTHQFSRTLASALYLGVRLQVDMRLDDGVRPSRLPFAAVAIRTPSIIDVPWAQKVSEAIEEVAKRHSATMAQVCIAWHLSKDFMTAPIIGTTSIEKLKDAVGGLKLKLSEDDIKAIDAPYEPRRIMGHK
ncbi:hypothetical protein FRB98_007296 [Tulasnella sp. 332]|nr:hypothetical protein FRB98_007296 [Tulasnella sp. 332]